MGMMRLSFLVIHGIYFGLVERDTSALCEQGQHFDGEQDTPRDCIRPALTEGFGAAEQVGKDAGGTCNAQLLQVIALFTT